MVTRHALAKLEHDAIKGVLLDASQSMQHGRGAARRFTWTTPAGFLALGGATRGVSSATAGAGGAASMAGGVRSGAGGSAGVRGALYVGAAACGAAARMLSRPSAAPTSAPPKSQEP
jgi:hypothetical protein